MGYLPPLITILLSVTAKAQDLTHEEDPFGYNDSVSHYIKKLRAGNIDSIIRFDLPTNYGYHDSLPGLGRIAYPSVCYVLYRSGNKTFITKYIWFKNTDCNSVEAMSVPLPPDNDTLFSWLDNHINTIKNDDICAFVARIQYNNTVRYLPWEYHHAPIFRIAFYTPDDNIVKLINTNHLEKQNDHNMANLNYEYNTGTKLYQLFMALEQHCKGLDKQFIFPGIR